MKCSYHPGVDARDLCNACEKPICSGCAHTVKGKPYCEDCLTQGAKWAATARQLRLPSDAPKRAALCAIIPGLGAVYNNEYLKAVTYFGIWAALALMSDRVSGVFGFGAFVFLIFTIFDAYRTAEQKARTQLISGAAAERSPTDDKTIVGGGIVLIVLGVLFLLQNMINYDFLHRLWPLLFIALGGYLVYFAMKRKGRIEVTVEMGDKTKKEGI